MALFKADSLTFFYPNCTTPVLSDISFSISKGEFLVLCGKSGCGKSTLLRHFKSCLTPHGLKSGRILFQGTPLESVENRVQSSKIGFIFQSPESQIVTDKVWHELAFGLESLGMAQMEIRLKVAEMASFFGIEEWFYQDVARLSGGQKQLLNLAAVMVMQPDILILDEPTSQLDPIAAGQFLSILGKINREIGTTVVLSEHRLEDVLPLSDKIIVMDHGEIIASGTAQEIGKRLQEINSDMFLAMPTPMRIHGGLKNNLPCPVSTRDGRLFLDKMCALGIHPIVKTPKPSVHIQHSNPTIEINEAWFRYEKNAPDIIKGLTLKAYAGELFALLGGNGAGKTTALSLITGLTKPYRGEIRVHGIPLAKIPDADKFNALFGVLPQNPKTLFVCKTVEEDLYEMLSEKTVSIQEKAEKVGSVAKLCNLTDLMHQHPYDLSGGQEQRAALAKVLLLEPKILLLDEPTKGFDAHFKVQFAQILNHLKNSGTTIIMVSHDVEFCASYADVCALFFDGSIVSKGTPFEFFSGNNFYTTAANRMAKEYVPNAITAEDVLSAYGAPVPQTSNNPVEPDNKKKGSPIQPIPLKQVKMSPKERRLSKRTIAAALTVLFLIPFTIYFGVYYLEDRKYYFISMVVILETMLPFFMVFEGRNPKAKELIVIAVLSAIAVCSRMAFFWLPQFKPVAAIVIIAGVAFGAESGFLVGAITAFVSNYFFGQGPWTPWQMFSFGIIGFLAGVLFKKGFMRRNKLALCAYGGISVLTIYGILMNTSTVITTQAKLSLEAVILAYIRGIPMDLIHAFSTVLFLFVLSEPMLEKLDRVKEKYGLIAP